MVPAVWSYARDTLVASVGSVPPVEVLYTGTLVGTKSSEPSPGRVSITTGLGR